MARLKGTNVYAGWTKSGGTLVALETNYRTYNIDRRIEKADASAGDDAHKTYLPTIKDGTTTLQILVEATDAIMDDITEGVEGVLILGREGNANGKPKITITGFVESLKESGSYNDVIMFDLTIQHTAAPVDGTFSA